MGSDVDILTVVQPIDESPEKLITFTKRVVGIQLEMGLCPDYDYPTDVISDGQLGDVVNGRGVLDVDGQLLPDGGVNDPEFDYVIWLYELITQQFELFGGKEELLERSTIEAINLTLLVALARIKIRLVSIDQLRLNIFEPTSRDLFLSQRQTDLLIDVVQKSNYAQIKRGLVLFDRDEVRLELSQLLDIRKKDSLIVAWKELRGLF